jgi:hypothetical protein
MMRLQRGIALLLLGSSAGLGACNDATSPATRCADFQGTWTSREYSYTASADPTVNADLAALGASISLTVDNNCNYTGTASIPAVTTGVENINGHFTLGSIGVLDLSDATALRHALDGTYQYTLSGNLLTLVNPGVEFDFDGAGPDPAFPATLTITFIKG